MTDDSVLVARDGAVLTLTLNRAHRRNAVDAATWRRLRDELTAAGDDPEVRALILTGAGTTFCAGGDLADTASERHPLHQMRVINEVIRSLHELPVPTIARVDGAAIGGGWNLALACDLVVASTRARFAQSFARQGLSVDCGGSWLLPRLVGMAQAKRLLLLAEEIDATRAHELGLVCEVVEPDAIDAVVAGLAARLAAGPPIAHGMTKALLHAGASSTLSEALEAEARAVAVNFATDVPAAYRAFVDRTEPEFAGRWLRM